jgi:hypothetical protein
MKIPASLESVKSRKSITDDVTITLVFNVWCSPDEIGALNSLYKKPIEITVEEVKQ